jgi:DNA-directed RNA polymerase I subunit RPA1
VCLIKVRLKGRAPKSSAHWQMAQNARRNTLKWDIINTAVERTFFSCYSSEEIAKLSVKCLTEPQTLDLLGNPIPGGLYDPALGPLEDFNERYWNLSEFSRCATCYMTRFNCEGHFGHIPLSVPILHPLFAKNLYYILNCKCYRCHRLRCTEDEVSFLLIYQRHKLLERLSLVEKGQIAEAFDSKFKFPQSGEDEDDEAAELELMGAGKKETSHVAHSRWLIVQEFLKMCHGRKNKCVNGECKAWYPKLTSDDSTRTFKVFLHQVSLMKRNGLTADQLWTHPKDPTDVRYRGNFDKLYLDPQELQYHAQRLWAEDSLTLKLVFRNLDLGPDGPQDKTSPSVFFLDVMPVPPNKFRPPAVVNGVMNDHAQNGYYKAILENNRTILSAKQVLKDKGELTDGESNQFREAWLALQRNASLLFDNQPSRVNTAPNGIRQTLEKKQGLFRQNMMGKRVNFAARSVISPDPYLQTNEIGLNDYFAMGLSFPEAVTDFNFKRLADAVVNGPKQWPGARGYEDENGRFFLLPEDNPTKRAAIAKSLRSHGKSQIKKVHRHLVSGDVVLMNRQPTLHKPSMMAHIVRVLKGPFFSLSFFCMR